MLQDKALATKRP
jgi:hypothetical protein